MDRQAKEKWLADALSEIRNKKLQNPVRLNAATIITNLERELQAIEKAMLFYDNKKILRIFVYKLNTLKNL